MASWNFIAICFLVCFAVTHCITINTQDLKFLAGTCPSKAGIEVDIKSLSGKWYTHGVVGSVSPISYLSCQTRTIIADERNDQPELKFQFKLPFFTGKFELTGTIDQKNKDRFEVTYSDSYFGNIKETYVPIVVYPSGATLMWGCMDFNLFHFETYLVSSKYPDIRDPRIPEKEVWEAIEAKVKKIGFSTRDLMLVNQTNCE